MRQLSFAVMGLILLGLMSSFYYSNPILDVKITDVRNAKGNFVLGFYKDEKSFNKREPFMRKQVDKTNLKNGVVHFKLTMPPGTYGIALLDDENKNGKMDYGFLLPTEGFGFSEYFHKGLSSPKFESFDFNMASANKTVVIKVKYM